MVPRGNRITTKDDPSLEGSTRDERNGAQITMTRVLHTSLRTVLAAGVALSVTALLPAADLYAQQGSGGAATRSQVLVPPLQVTDGVDDDIGQRVSEQVYERLQNFDVLSAVDEEDVENAMDKFDLDEDEMTPIQWRQLANQIGAGLVLSGQISRGTGGDDYQFDVSFVDVTSGDELSVEPFGTSGGDDDVARDAADTISRALQRQVRFLRRLSFCNDYYQSDQHEDALSNCNQALEVNPNSSRALMLRGRVYMEMEDWESAREDLSRVVEASPSNTDALQSLAYANAQMGNQQRAMELYREYLTFNPDDDDVRLAVAYDLANAGASDQAMRIIQEGLERDSTATPLWEYLGLVSLQAGTQGAQAQTGASAQVTDTTAIRTAVDAYERVLAQKDSIDAQLLRNTIAAHRLIGDLEGALEFSEQALEEYPDNASLWSNRADVLAEMDRYGEAIEALNTLIEVDQDYPNAYQKRATFRLEQGDTEGAMEDFHTAVERGADPDQVASRIFSLAYNQFFENQQYADALPLFQRSLELAEEPQTRRQIEFFTAWTYFQRGMALDQSNEQEACDPAQRALELFQQAGEHLANAGDYQQAQQQKLQQSIDDYLYRERQIIKKACQ